MTKKIAALLAVASLLGCAATVKPMTTPDGKQGFAVECNGGVRTWVACYEAATKVCGGKYSVIDKNESTTPTLYGPLIRRNMIVECRQ